MRAQAYRAFWFHRDWAPSQAALERRKCTDRLPATIDGATSKPVSTTRVNLKTLDGVRLEMSKVYCAMKTGGLDGADGTKRPYVLSLIGKLIIHLDGPRELGVSQSKEALHNRVRCCLA